MRSRTATVTCELSGVSVEEDSTIGVVASQLLGARHDAGSTTSCEDPGAIDKRCCCAVPLPSDTSRSDNGVEAPASRLPFPDAAFDRVLSAFAAIFDPDHEATAAELARVCAPGGAIALTAWIPEGPLAAVAGLLRRGAPPPPGGARSPIGWADEAYARERLEPLGLAVEVSRETLAFEAASVEARVAAEERDTPAWVAARERLGADWPALRAELTAVLAAGNEATDGSFRVTSAYALIVARRPA